MNLPAMDKSRRCLFHSGGCLPRGREGHYGLPGMRERGKLAGGKLTVWSKLDSGKTTVLSALRSAVEIQGYEVQGFGPTSRAVRQLRDAGIESGTLQGFLPALLNFL